MKVSNKLYGATLYNDVTRMAFYMLLFSNVRNRRLNFEWQWEEAAALVWPEYRNSFAYGRVTTPGVKLTQFQLDSKAAIASHRFASIMDNLATPSAMLWSRVRPGGKNAKKLWQRRRVREYFCEVTNTLWRERYRPEANFAGQNFQNWQALGVFGNMGMMIEELDTSTGLRPGLAYRATPPGEIYVLQSEQGRVNGFIRHFRRDAQQARELCNREGMEYPAVLAAAERTGSKELYNFLQICHPNVDYRPWEFATPKGKMFCSVYISVEGFCIMGEGGYHELPLSYDRYMQAPDEDYGRGPAQMVLPALKTMNAMKRVYMTQGHLAGDPAYLLPDDGTFDFKTHSGAFNYGGMSQDGKMLVGILPTGQIQYTEEMLKNEGAYVDSAFLVDLFSITWDNRDTQKSARQIIEEANEKGVFLAPGVGRTATEYTGPMQARELAVLSRLGLLPKLPPELVEAQGEWDHTMVSCSPIARAMRGQERAGYMQTVEMATTIANAGHPEVWDYLSGGFSRAIPALAEDANVPEDWMPTPQEIAQAQKTRQDAAAQDAQVKSLPGQAAIMKAKAISDKAQAGQNIGGALSGTPQGQTPSGFGAPPGTQGQAGEMGQPGQPGQPGGQ